MRKLPYKIERGTITADDGVAILTGDDDLRTELLADAYNNIGLDLMLTIGDVTMFASAWEDPDHWAEDWAEKLGVDLDAAPAAVAALLSDAIEDA